MSVRGYNGCTAPRGRSCFQGRALAPCARALARAGRDERVRGISADVALGPSCRARCAAASPLLCAGSTRDHTIVPKGTCPAGAGMMIFIEIRPPIQYLLCSTYVVHGPAHFAARLPRWPSCALYRVNSCAQGLRHAPYRRWWGGLRVEDSGLSRRRQKFSVNRHHEVA